MSRRWQRPVFFDSRSKNWPPPWRDWIDYRRQDEIFSIAYEQHDARFVAEICSADGECRHVAVIAIRQPPSAAAVRIAIKEFAAAVDAFLEQPGAAV